MWYFIVIYPKVLLIIFEVWEYAEDIIVVLLGREADHSCQPFR